MIWFNCRGVPWQAVYGPAFESNLSNFNPNRFQIRVFQSHQFKLLWISQCKCLLQPSPGLLLVSMLALVTSRVVWNQPDLRESLLPVGVGMTAAGLFEEGFLQGLRKA
jgi:hypothetical protein